jgi:endogenous inhibitor of DNA gyrase (YacG/DUF329 family)
MPELKIKCPNCNSIIGTGIALGAGTKFRPENFQQNLTQCPNCGRSVVWNGIDVINKEEFGQ